ncbi:MAG TPA: hypothetical protein VI432_00635 [Candidatus Paceibacterota bacterium]
MKRVDFTSEQEEIIKNIGEQVDSRYKSDIERGIETEKRQIFKEVIEDHSKTIDSDDLKREQAEHVKEFNSTPEDNRLQKLVDYAASKGPIEASILVKKIGDPWLEDQLHDVLIKFHDELIKRGRLKEE